MIARAVLLSMCVAVGSAYAGDGPGANCAIHTAPCVAMTDSGVEVELSIAPRPVAAMQDLEFRVVLSRKGRPVSGAAVVLDLSMPGMFMGNNQPRLSEERPGRFRGRGVIPRCVTGQRTWKAFVAVAQGGSIEKVFFLFEVQ